MQLEYHNNQNGHRHGIVQSFDGRPAELGDLHIDT
jgi:hypothetical protein